MFGGTIIDLSQTISHMQPVANYHVNQRPAFWHRITHETTLGTFAHAPDLSWQIRDFLIGEHVSTHVNALCHYTPGDEAWCMERMPLDWFITSAVCVNLSAKRPEEFIEPADLETALAHAGLTDRRRRHVSLPPKLLRPRPRAALPPRLDRAQRGRRPLAGRPGRSQHRLRDALDRQLAGDAERRRSLLPGPPRLSRPEDDQHREPGRPDPCRQQAVYLHRAAAQAARRHGLPGAGGGDLGCGQIAIVRI